MAQKTGSNEKGQSGAQSPELAGGAGFTFEDAVSAYFLSALLGEGYAPGVENRTVCRVALQQRNFGEPLDDVIVDFLDTTLNNINHKITDLAGCCSSNSIQTH